MPDLRQVSRRELIIFPVVGMVLCTFPGPGLDSPARALFFGNIMKESGVVDRLANTARTAIIDTATIILGLTVGASTQGDVFLNPKSVGIFLLGAIGLQHRHRLGHVVCQIHEPVSQGEDQSRCSVRPGFPRCPVRRARST
jgi:Na+-transporting methylmalonyl-CoA/oxaloacetate decarboxylase beta subunit